MAHKQFSSQLVARNLKQLDAKLAKVVTFRQPDDEDSALKTAGKTAAVLGGVGALAAGGLYARGRLGAGAGAPRVGIADTIKGGANLAKSDAANAFKGAIAGVKSGYKTGASSVTSAAMQAGKVASSAVNPVLDVAKKAALKLKLRK